MRLRTVLWGAFTLALLLGTALAAASLHSFCGGRLGGGPKLLEAIRVEGPLRAGAARVELAPPLPVVIAGYAPPRSVARRLQHPLYARAVVLAVEKVQVAIVSVDTLLVPDKLREQIATDVAPLGFSSVWVVATHTHSSFGGFDDRLFAQVVGTGRYREDSARALVQGAVTAIREAHARLGPATAATGVSEYDFLASSRVGGQVADHRLTKLVFRGESGPVAQWLVTAAHPTLVPKRLDELDPDFPGAFSALEEAAGHGVTLLSQGAAGNAMVDFGGGDSAKHIAQVAEALAKASRELAVADTVPTSLALSRATVDLPSPDSSRWTGDGPWRTLGDNLFCVSAPRRTELSVLRLGQVTLLAVPGEPTDAAGKAIEASAGASRVVSLANGYLGYVESEEVVAERQGEARRQYFTGRLATVLEDAARLAVRAVHE